MNKIDELIALGNAATKGEWDFFSKGDTTDIHNERGAIVEWMGFDMTIHITRNQHNRNAAFITAAANARDDVKKMRDEFKEQEQMLLNQALTIKKLREALSQLVKDVKAESSENVKWYGNDIDTFEAQPPKSEGE